MILLGSRYQRAPVDYVIDGRTGVTHATVFPPALSQAGAGFDVWYWRSGDRLDLLSNQVYRRPDQWWRILDANPEIVDPNAIRVGSMVRVPR